MGLRSIFFFALLALVLAEQAIGQAAATQPSYSESIAYAPRTLPTPKPGSRLEKWLLSNPSKPAPRQNQANTSSNDQPVGAKDVVVPFSVLDGSGNFIEGLRKEEVTVFSANRRLDVVALTVDPQPYTVILVIDTKAWTSYPLLKLQDIALAVIEQLHPDDQVMVVGYNKTYKIFAEPTKDRVRIRKAVRDIRFVGSNSVLFDTVQYLFDSVMPSIPGQKALVLISDGYDDRSTNSSYESTLFAIEQSDVTLFAVYLDNFEPNYRSISRETEFWGTVSGATGVTTAIGSLSDTQELVEWRYKVGSFYMNDLVFASGGRAMFAGDILIDSKKRKYDIGQQLRRQYYLTFRMPAGVAGTRRQLRMRVNRPGLAILTRGSYVVPRSTPMN